MWIQNNRGKLRMCERYTDIDGNVHRVSVPLLRDTPRERKAAYTELMEKVKMADSGGAEIRFSELVEKYLSRPDIKDSTRHNYRSRYNVIGQIIGNPVVSDINTGFVKRKMAECDKPPQTQNLYIRELKNIIHFAREYGYTKEVLEIRPYKVRSTETIEDKYLTPEELQEILEKLPPNYYYFCKFLALTGCRIGEASALTVSDYDGKYIHINKNVWNGRVGSTKTESSERDLFVQEELKELLDEYLRYRNVRLITHTFRTDLLFFGNTGEPISRQSINDVLHRVQSTKRLHSHIFRHTHASLLAEQGYSLEAISRRLGHSNSGITKKIYLHVTEKMKEKEEMQLDRIRLID